MVELIWFGFQSTAKKTLKIGLNCDFVSDWLIPLRFVSLFAYLLRREIQIRIAFGDFSCWAKMKMRNEVAVDNGQGVLDSWQTVVVYFCFIWTWIEWHVRFEEEKIPFWGHLSCSMLWSEDFSHMNLEFFFNSVSFLTEFNHECRQYESKVLGANFLGSLNTYRQF